MKVFKEKRTKWIILFFIFFSLMIKSGFCEEFLVNSQVLEPQQDFDFVILLRHQSKTVTADFMHVPGVQIIPVVCIGTGKLSVSLNRNTHGEIIGLFQAGTGDPQWDYNIGFTPVNITLVPINIEGVGFVLLGSTILFSTEEPPYEYGVNLGF